MRAPAGLLFVLLVGCSGESGSPTPATGAHTGATAAATNSPSNAGTSAASASAMSSADSAPGSAVASASAAPPVEAPAGIVVPSTIAAGDERPFVLVLHGLGGSGESFASALGIARLASEKRFVYAAPDGELDSKGRRFWNASRACCDFDHRGVDHVASLGAIIGQAKKLPSVDPARIYVIGFSNGAFMAHRLACSVPGIAAIASVAGAGPTDGDPPCTPAKPVAVLEVHGDFDRAVGFEGGHVLGMKDVPAHPSVASTMNAWAKLDGCGETAKEEARVDLMPSLPGAETHELRYPGCKAPVEIWRVEGGDHGIAANAASIAAIWSFLEKSVTPR